MIKFFNKQKEQQVYEQAACAPVPNSALPVPACVRAMHRVIHGALARAGARAQRALLLSVTLLTMPAGLLPHSTFGWTLKNEIGNGRWVMFGLLVGMMTEYATGALSRWQEGYFTTGTTRWTGGEPRLAGIR